MSGFFIQAVAPERQFTNTVYLVDVGRGDIQRTVVRGQARAVWVRWLGTRQLTVHEYGDRILFVEGQPDRAPNSGETAAEWLPGRTGSFRGFEIRFPQGDQPVRICIFVDPLASRPIFLLSSRESVSAADKLTTVVANNPGVRCSWGELLEAAVLGSTYSAGTTIEGVEQLAPGESIEIHGTEIVRRQTHTYQLDFGVKPNTIGAARRLHESLRTAIRDTWVDPDCHLLLSGGLDSRLVLGLSSGQRKTISLDWYTDESAIVRRVADACGAQLKAMAFCPEDYCTRMRLGYLVTGAMHQSALVNTLGQASSWRDQGIPAIIHGYFHNTIFRGWTTERWVRFPDLSTPLAQYMGAKAHYFDTFGQFRLPVRSQVLTLLSADGRSLLKRHLSHLAETIDPIVIDGFDVTFERLLLRNVARQVYFGIFLGWLEEIDVESPVFHQAAWNWYASTHPSDRYHDACVRALYQMIGRGLAEIPDFTSGKPVRVLPPAHDPQWRNQFWFPPARAAAHIARRFLPARKLPTKGKATHNWDRIYWQQPIVDALSAGIESARAIPLFDSNALADLLSKYMAGQAQNREALWAIATIGQFATFVARPSLASPISLTATNTTGVPS